MTICTRAGVSLHALLFRKNIVMVIILLVSAINLMKWAREYYPDIIREFKTYTINNSKAKWRNSLVRIIVYNLFLDCL